MMQLPKLFFQKEGRRGRSSARHTQIEQEEKCPLLQEERTATAWGRSLQKYGEENCVPL